MQTGRQRRDILKMLKAKERKHDKTKPVSLEFSNQQKYSSKVKEK